MTNQELYKQAILDARALRETALANAKESLAETFQPRIKEMLRMKLSEELEEELQEKTEEEEDETMEEAYEEGATMEEGDNMEEATLEEILAELNAISEEMEKGKNMEEAKKGKDDETIDEAEEKEEDEEPTEDDEEGEAAGTEGEADDDEKVVSITVGELKDIFRDVLSQVQGGGASEMGAPELGAPGEEEEGMMAELSLDEILAELEEDEMKMEEAATPGEYKDGKPTPVEEAKKAIEEKKKTEKEPEDAKKAIKEMRTQLQEVNLLNAKLLYVNKLWKAKSLNESQKVKVLNAFDRATTVKEAENIFKTLSESLVAPKKADLKESMGFASKPIGSAPAKPIVEADSMVERWKTLAGIK